jgi:hypothetical protein
LIPKSPAPIPNPARSIATSIAAAIILCACSSARPYRVALDEVPDSGAPPVSACRACEQTSCPSLLAACEEAEGNAAAGPAAGQPRRELCGAVIGCVRASGCAASAVEDCYCGPGVDPLACLTGGAAGACKGAFEAAAESSDGFIVAERFFDPQFAVGNAVALLGCDRDLCSAACGPEAPPADASPAMEDASPPPPEDAATPSADAGAPDAATPMPGCGVPDAAPAEDAAPADAAENATPDAAEDATPDGPTLTCRTCQQASCPALLAACEEAEGTAVEGPAAGQPKRELCASVIECTRTTGCAASAVEECYCGAGVDPLVCLTGGASGVCKAAFEAAAESSDGFVVAERFVDPQFAVGNAVQLLGCGRDLCQAACF